MQIETSRFLIRSLRENDAEEFYAYRSAKELKEFQSAYTLDKAKELIAEMKDRNFGKRGEWFQLVIEEKNSASLVGDIGLKPELYDERVVEIGITISKNKQRQGIGKEVLRALITELFAAHNVHRFIAYVDAENTASLHLFSALGFRKEGFLKKSFWNKNAWRDEILFALLEEDLATKQNILPQ